MKILDLINRVNEQNNSALFYTPPYYKNSKSYLFNNPVEVIKCNTSSNILDTFAEIDKRLENELVCFGLVKYEAGLLLENSLIDLVNKSKDILTFVFFNKHDVQEFQSSEIDHTGIAEKLKSSQKIISDFKLNTSNEEYISSIQKIKKYIENGDTYQVNYTTTAEFNLVTTVKKLYCQLIFNQTAKYSALINIDNTIVFTVSPELFFKKNRLQITAHPMKGTIKRGRNSWEDLENINSLKKSSKDRAENVMIVDLLRNDLGRICEYNSVSVPELYKIEKYESLFQMISIVNGKLRNNNLKDIFENIFPCGSITGAPKIETMKIINELEGRCRGIYTGAIGIADKNKSIFNVPIRTIEINKNNNRGSLGIGSGIVWDSSAEKEYEETLLKGDFLLNPDPYFELFETILIENKKPYLLDDHLGRLNSAADYFMFIFSKEKIIKQLEEFISHQNELTYVIKVKLDKWGNLNISKKEFSKSKGHKIFVDDKNKIEVDKFKFFKTTNRNLYDKKYKHFSNRGFVDVIFLNKKNFITEGSITNIFIKKQQQWYTPDLSNGILNGCYRKLMIDKKNVIETNLSISDLIESKEVIITNSVRKEITISEIHTASGRIHKI